MPLKTQREEQSSLNLTPLIDIVFLLIIFFMVGTKFSELSEAERDIPLSVPQVADAGTLTAAPKKWVINVYQNGAVLLEDQPVSLQQLQQKLISGHRQYNQLGVIVRGDASALYQHVADVLAACRTAQITDLGISVRVAQKP